LHRGEIINERREIPFMEKMPPNTGGITITTTTIMNLLNREDVLFLGLYVGLIRLDNVKLGNLRGLKRYIWT